MEKQEQDCAEMGRREGEKQKAKNVEDGTGPGRSQ